MAPQVKALGAQRCQSDGFEFNPKNRHKGKNHRLNADLDFHIHIIQSLIH